MGRNMNLRLGVDASDFEKKMQKAGIAAENTGKRIKKGLSVNLGAETAKIMGWGNEFTGIGAITASTLGLAQSQLATLRAYRDQLAGAGFDDYQFGAVSERIKELEYDIDAYSQNLQQAAEAEKEVAQEASEMGNEIGKSGRKAGSFSSRMINALRGIVSHAYNSNRSLERMVQTIRNVSVVSFGLRIARGLFGEFSSIIRNHISQDAQLKAQMDGLSASLGQALAPAIQIVANAMSYLLPYIVGVSNAIGSLMAMLFGSGWSAAASGANKVASSTGSAAKAQKEMNRQLLSFDQITKLDSQKDAGGSGGSGATTTTGPIEAKVPAWVERMKKIFAELFESDEFQAANLGKKIGMVLNASIGEAVSALSGVDFSAAGSVLADNFNSMIGAIDWNNAGQLMGAALMVLPFTVIGFIQAADWPLIGNSVSEFLISSLGSVGEQIRSIDWVQIGTALATFFSNVDYAGISQSFGNLLGSALGAVGKTLWGMIKNPLLEFDARLRENMQKMGGDAVAGFFWSIGEGVSDMLVWLWEKFCKPIIDGVKEGFGIHSPSKVFGDIGDNCISSLADRFGAGASSILQKVQDLRNRVTDAASKLKEAFSFEWSLPHLRLPHLQVDWDPVDSVLANFFGVSAFPRLSVQWFAKGGILDGAQIFGRMGSTLLGGGERGREAILPLDTNTGWMDVLANRISQSLNGEAGGDVNATIRIEIDGEELTTKVINGLRRRSRSGAPAF